MTTLEVLGAIKRRWYVSVVVFAAAAALVFLFARDGGLYTTRTVVSFMWPSAAVLEPGNGATELSIVAFAGAVATDINDGRAPQGYGTGEAPYFGAGIREGVIVGLEDRGNQWVSDFSRAEIAIQVVGRTREWVEEKQAMMIERVMGVAERQQDELGARPKDRIAVSVVPLTQAIDHIVPNRTSQIAAIGAMALAACIVSAWGSVALDRGIERSRRTVRASQPVRPRMGGVTA